MARALAWTFVLGVGALIGLIPGSGSPSDEYTMEKIVCPEKVTVQMKWESAIGSNPALSLAPGNESQHAFFLQAFEDIGPSAACVYDTSLKKSEPGFRALYHYVPAKKKILSCTVTDKASAPRVIHCKVVDPVQPGRSGVKPGGLKQ